MIHAVPFLQQVLRGGRLAVDPDQAIRGIVADTMPVKRLLQRTARLSPAAYGLSDRLKHGAYRAKPIRRVYLPKPDGRQRPLGGLRSRC